MAGWEVAGVYCIVIWMDSWFEQQVLLGWQSGGETGTDINK